MCWRWSDLSFGGARVILRRLGWHRRVLYLNRKEKGKGGTMLGKVCEMAGFWKFGGNESLNTLLGPLCYGGPGAVKSGSFHRGKGEGLLR